MKSTLLIGKNYHSFLISFALFERNKKVLLIDDHSKDFDDKNVIFDFERVILNTWGLDCQIPHLLELDNYLSPGRYCLIFDHIHLNLGGSPSENYDEILRKFPRLLSLDPLKNEATRKKFDLMFKTFSENFGVKLFRFMDQENLKMETVWDILPEELKNIFLDFKEQSKKEELKFIFCFFQGFYQHRFSHERSDFQLLFILLFLLSPRYEINRKKFEDDLFKFFKKGGGQVVSGENLSFQTKGSDVNQFSIPGIDPFNLEKIFLTIGEFLGVPLTTDSNSSYTSLKIRLNLKISDLEGQEFIVSGNDQMGGSHPLTRFKFEKDGLIGEVLTPFIVGSKESFDEEEAFGILLRDLKNVLGEFPKEDLEPSSFHTQKFWIQDFEAKSNVSIKWPFFPRPVKNLFIFHTPKSSALGSLSMLAQIKDERGHIL